MTSRGQEAGSAPNVAARERVAMGFRVSGLFSSHDRKPVIGRGSRQLSFRATSYLRPRLKRTTRSRIEPGHAEGPGCTRTGHAAQIQLGISTLGQVNEIKFARLREAVAAVVVLLIADQRVRIIHFP